jgi:outer membrane autotransporter protein
MSRFQSRLASFFLAMSVLVEWGLAARAVDLPLHPPSAQLKICWLMSGGFFYIPASDVCPTSMSREAVAVGLQYSALQAMDQFLGLALDRPNQEAAATDQPFAAIAYRPEPTASSPVVAATADETAAFAPRWSLWARGMGGKTSISDSAQSAGTESRVAAMVAGAGVQIEPNLGIGLALSFGKAEWSLNGDGGTGTSNMIHVGVHGKQRFGASFISAAVAYAYHDAAVDRVPTNMAIGHLAARFHAHNVAARIEAGHEVKFEALDVTPHAALQVQRLAMPAFNEAPSGLSANQAVAYQAHVTNQVRTELGAHVSRRFLLADRTVLALGARVAWAHEFDIERDLDATYVSGLGNPFLVTGPKLAADLAVVSASADILVWRCLSMSGKFNAELADGVRSYAGTLGLKLTW